MEQIIVTTVFKPLAYVHPTKYLKQNTEHRIDGSGHDYRQNL